MKRQPYFPRTLAERIAWFSHYGTELPLANVVLGLPAGDVTNSMNDAGYCEYALGDWLAEVRGFGHAGTSAVDDLFHGSGGGTFVLPTFTAPAVPPAVGSVAPGALDRIFAFLQTIKACSNYSEAIGLQLQIVGAEDTSPAGSLVPVYTLAVERNGAAQQIVRVSFKKAGHQGVIIHGKRGGGDWEMLAIDLTSPYMDSRPLLVPGQPEVREYRLQYYASAAPIGDFSMSSTITVSP